ncbi:MAG: hypothetical protein HYR63_03840 [Proteobacteria bacterium]|nr:hypothetical protein [Pseudomonadota bacterium]MBI3498591.1 hypothetical protein [Pseudomonadota bacterium]
MIAAKVVCCGGLCLAATGTLSGFGAWLTGSGHVWIGAAVGALLIAIALCSIAVAAGPMANMAQIPPLDIALVRSRGPAL